MRQQITIPIDLPLDPDAWEDAMMDGSREVLFLHDYTFVIGGVSYHVEARKVSRVQHPEHGDLQELDYGDTDQMWEVFGADGHIQTHTIGDAEYIVFLYPFCE